jgi:DNA invertase Pin-like site-specific DNA recombinase
MSARSATRCAIYTRKSTEEGLDQGFNSLHAQRDACEAYVSSQRSEGWTALKTHYDDGGFSGGTLDRPALKSLLQDIEAGKLDVVVVYKIDRLSRSLMDFAKLVEVFERKSVTFVSVTQSFNTTTSMGRLTLNVLLSFAQFEREVTGERIRDKFTASKKKGMWMGGTPPLGYDVHERKLVVNPAEAEIVRTIFRLYLDLGSTRRLRDELKVRNIRSKAWTAGTGRVHAGYVFSRGALFHLLKNPVYVGQIRHKSETYPGEHEGIVPAELFEAAQKHFADSLQAKHAKVRARHKSLLEGILIDEAGASMTPSYSNNRLGMRYKYYISGRQRSERSTAGITRVPAIAIEDLVRRTLNRLRLLRSNSLEIGDEGLRQLLARVDVGSQTLSLRLDRSLALKVWQDALDSGDAFDANHLLDHARSHLHVGEQLNDRSDHLHLVLPVRARFRGGRAAILIPNGPEGKVGQPDIALIKGIARAQKWRAMLQRGEVDSIEAIAKKFDLDRSETGRTLGLAYLSPAITKSILEGNQLPALRLKHLLDADIPLAWHKQVAMLKEIIAAGTC